MTRRLQHGESDPGLLYGVGQGATPYTFLVSAAMSTAGGKSDTPQYGSRCRQRNNTPSSYTWLRFVGCFIEQW